jgi:hypothetical protein
MSLTQFNCTTSVAGGQKVTTAVSGGISLNEIFDEKTGRTLMPFYRGVMGKISGN